MQKYQNSFCRSTSNYDDDTDEASVTVPVDDGVGVQHVEHFQDEQEEVGGGGGGDDGAAANPKPSTSNTAETRKVGPSTIHIQKPRAVRMSEASKQRQQVTSTFIELLQKEQERELKEDDELDATFAGCASRMRKHLNENQREDVIQEINRVVNEAINNVRARLPAVMNQRNLYIPPMQPAPQMPPPMRPQQNQQQHQQQQSNQQQLASMQPTPPTPMFEYNYQEL